MTTMVSQKTLKLFQPLAEVRRHKRWQPYIGITLPGLIVAGWFFPPVGYVMLACMIAGMSFGMAKGRYWCDWMCPRGSCWDSYLSRLSPKRRVPRFFRHTAWRLFWLGLLMTVMTVVVVLNWGDWYRIGLIPFWMILTVTTVVGLGFGLLYNQRTWCMFCPVGSMANFLGRGKRLLRVSPECLGANCKLCYKTCRMQIHPGTYKDTGIVKHGDCLKCSRCIEVCPKEALSWAGPKVTAAEARPS